MPRGGERGPGALLVLGRTRGAPRARPLRPPAIEEDRRSRIRRSVCVTIRVLYAIHNSDEEVMMKRRGMFALAIGATAAIALSGCAFGGGAPSKNEALKPGAEATGTITITASTQLTAVARKNASRMNTASAASMVNSI